MRGRTMKESEQPRVLVVEDEVIIALDRAMPDCAILDINTADGEVYPLADALTDAGVSIIFHSGRVSPAEVIERYPEAQACAKPCPPGDLVEMLCVATRARTPH